MLGAFRNGFLPTAEFVERAYSAFEGLDADSIRMRRGDGTKKLIEEVLPIAAFLKYLEIPERRITCRLAEANQDHDAMIRVSGTYVEHGYFQASYYVEVTTAPSPWDHLEREAVTTNGFVFGGGKIRRDPTTGQLVSEAVAVNGTDAVTNLAASTAARIEDKCLNTYQQPCILILAVHPERPFEITEWAELASGVSQAGNRDRFAARYAVDWSTNMVFPV
jgi:hypothetical protein